MIDLTLTPPAPPVAGGVIQDTTAARFEADVLEVSLTTPVIVDFWAPWCGPCRQMMPVLEKAVGEAGGAVRMVKVDIDKNPELAQAFRVQSVPMVYAFFQGKPVDGFTGSKPESELRAFVKKLEAMTGHQRPVVIDTKQMMTAAEAFFKAEDYINAMAQYSHALDADPDNMTAMAGIGQCFLAQKDIESVSALLEQLDDPHKAAPQLAGLKFFVQAAEQSFDAASLTAQVEKDPKNHNARYDLARALLAAADAGGAIDQLVELTRRDREWQEQKARQLLIRIFDALGTAHPLVSAGRRKLSAVLFS